MSTGKLILICFAVLVITNLIGYLATIDKAAKAL